MKLNSIQVLRAMAVLLVVYTHAIDLQMNFSVSHQQHFFRLQNFGAIGVDLFFVISGFIITWVAHQYQGARQGLYFLAKRFRRINPVYYLASLLAFGVDVLYSWTSGQMHAISLYNTLNALADTIIILPRTGSIDLFKPFLFIGWTLAFEWLFYFLFFLTILSGYRHKFLLSGSLIMGLVTLGYLFNVHDLRYKFITNPIMLEFLLGMAICQIRIHMKKIPFLIPLAFLLTGITAYLLMIIFGYGPISEHHAVMTADISGTRFFRWGIPSAFIVFGCIFLENDKHLTRLWNNKLLVLTGDASYSIYLVHITVFTLFTIVYKQWGFFMDPDVAIIVQAGTAIVAGVGFYKWVEKPLTQGKRQPAMNKSTANPPAASADNPAPEAVS